MIRMKPIWPILILIHGSLGVNDRRSVWGNIEKQFASRIKKKKIQFIMYRRYKVETFSETSQAVSCCFLCNTTLSLPHRLWWTSSPKWPCQHGATRWSYSSPLRLFWRRLIHFWMLYFTLSHFLSRRQIVVNNWCWKKKTHSTSPWFVVHVFVCELVCIWLKLCGNSSVWVALVW